MIRRPSLLVAITLVAAVTTIPIKPAVAEPICGCEKSIAVLMEFYHATNGPSWFQNSGWSADGGSAGRCSMDWFGLKCDGVKGVVSEINLPANNLQGTLLDSSSWLTFLVNVTHLFFNNNRLYGTLPDVWRTSAINLEVLRLDHNEISGTLPPLWGPALRKLQVLDVFDNRITGSLPELWGAFPSLQSMYLSSNRLSGSLPHAWGSLTSLGHLYVFNNSLRGTIPGTPWSTMRSLQNLVLSQNELVGTIPVEILSIPTLQLFSVSFNRLRGPVPFMRAPPSSSSLMLVFDVQNNSDLTDDSSVQFPPQMSMAFGKVTLCGTRICRPSPYTPWQYCLPNSSISFEATSILAVNPIGGLTEVNTLLFPFTHGCNATPTPPPTNNGLPPTNRSNSSGASSNTSATSMGLGNRRKALL